MFCKGPGVGQGQPVNEEKSHSHLETPQHMKFLAAPSDASCNYPHHSGGHRRLGEGSIIMQLQDEILQTICIGASQYLVSDSSWADFVDINSRPRTHTKASLSSLDVFD
jgi:hypothetical protein